MSADRTKPSADTSIAMLAPRALIGMVHLAPLPGSPASTRSLASVAARAVSDARVLAEAGFDALMIENFGDTPFRADTVDPHTVASMTVVVRAIRDAVALPFGLNVLRNDAISALAIAVTCGGAFVRVNVHCGVYATDQGIVQGKADETLRYRRQLCSNTSAAQPIPAIFADVHVKHARSMREESLDEAAEETAYRGRADGLIVSGATTGRPTDMNHLSTVRHAVPDRPIYVGSGTTESTVAALLSVADGAIVGTSIKKDNITTAQVDPQKAAALVTAAKG